MAGTDGDLRRGKVICLIRAADHEAATRRLAAAFEGDAALEQRFRELSAGHLEVVVGDVAEPHLGVDDATYDRLARDVDRIVHPAALVNHMLDYEYLFGPNVAGTAELVALALTHRQKRFDFVSSLAATWLVERSGGVDEDSPLRQTVALSQDYSAGYAASKWAAEHVLHSAHRRFGVPVNVFRGDMMLPHSRYHEQVNVPDIFIRLLYSIVTTGLAPVSFYELEPDGSRPQGALRRTAGRLRRRGDRRHQRARRTATSGRSTCSTTTRTTASRWTPSSTGSRRPATGWSASDPTVSGCSASRTSSRPCPRSSASTPR